MAYDFSYVEVQTTAPLQVNVGGINSLILNKNSTMNYFGGETGGIRFYDDARAVFEGGRIDYISSYQRPLSGDWPPSYWDKHIEIICKDWSWNELTNLLTGTWADDTAFSIQLVDQTGYHPAITNIEFTIIPEPVTIALLAIGAVFLKKKR